MRTAGKGRHHSTESIGKVLCNTFDSSAKCKLRTEQLPFTYDAAVNAESTWSISLPAFNEFNFLSKGCSTGLFAQTSNYSLTREQDEMDASKSL